MTTRHVRALSVRQPWAWAIIHGGKSVENRVWRRVPRFTLPVTLAIHAGRTPHPEGLADPRVAAAVERAGLIDVESAMSLGAIVGLVTLEDVHPDRGCCRPWGESAPYGTAIHLVLRDPHALARPVRYQGRLGLWDLELPVAAEVLSLAYPTSSGVYVGA